MKVLVRSMINYENAIIAKENNCLKCEGKSVKYYNVKVIITKKITTQYKYVVCFYVENCFLDENQI